MSASEDVIKIVASAEASEETTTDENGVETPVAEQKAVTKKNGRSKKYAQKRSLVDRTKKYTLIEAITLVKKLSYSAFAGSITLDAVVKDVGKLGTLSLPHSTGKVIRVGIVDDALLAEIETGVFNFDVLVTTPQHMPKLAKFARVLGPKGLMPNPKNGTVTPKPEQKKKELEKGAIELKTEKKAPVIHITIGKTTTGDDELIANIAEIFKVTGGKIRTATLSATMSPSVKIIVE